MGRSIQRIVSIGEVMIELSVDSVDSVGGHSQISYAGDTYNTAIYLSRELTYTQKQVDYITALGEDEYSVKIMQSLEKESIGTQNIEIRGDKIPGLYAISTDDAGERSFQYWRVDSAARTLFVPPSSITLEALQQYDLLYFSAITLAIVTEQVRQQLLAAIKVLRKAGVLIAFDSNYRPKLWQNQQIAQKWVSEIWCHTDIALPSVDDEMALFGDSNEQAVLERLHDYGIRYGALKRGAQGPLSLGLEQSSATAWQNYPKAARVVDTTAAGDSFNAGFLAAYVQGQGIQNCLLKGHELACEVIGYHGAIMPRPVE